MAGAVDGTAYPAIDCAAIDVAAAVAAAAVAAITDAAADTSVTETVVTSVVFGAAVSVAAAFPAAAAASALAAAAAAVTGTASKNSVTDADAIAVAVAAPVLSVSGGTFVGSEHHVRVRDMLLLWNVRIIITAAAIADANVVNSSLPHERHIISTATPAALRSRNIIAGTATAVSRSVEKDVGARVCRPGVGQRVLETAMFM